MDTIGIYDAHSNRIQLDNTIITVTKELIYDVMTFMCGGLDIMQLDGCAKDNAILQEWKTQYPRKKYSSKAYFKKNRRIARIKHDVQLNFLTFFINTFIKSKHMGTSQIKIVNLLI